jgi:hypothetical protein
MNADTAMQSEAMPSIVSVYEFYDRPVLYSAQSRDGTLLLVLLIDEGPTEDMWLCVEVSRQRLGQVERGEIGVRSAFCQAEGGEARILHEDVATGLVTATQRIGCSLLPEDMLPASDIRLAPQGGTESQPTNADSPNLDPISKPEELTMRFTSDCMPEGQIEASVLGALLTAVQETVSAIGKALATGPTKRGSLPADVVEQTQLLVTATAVGSFRVRMVSRYPAGLFGDSLISESLCKLFDLIEAGDSRTNVPSQLRELGSRAASKYEELAKTLVESRGRAEFRWIRPQGDRRQTRLTFESAERLVQMLRQIPVQPVGDIIVTGRLVGADEERAEFHLRDLVDDNEYKGSVAQPTVSALTGAVIGQTYQATLSVSEHQRPGQEELVQEYTLTDLVPASAPA